MSNLTFPILICIIFKIISQTTSKIDKEYIQNLKEVSEFEVFDYEEHPFKDWTLDELKTLTGSDSFNYYEKMTDSTNDIFSFLEGVDDKNKPNQISMI
jgi:hypothetical protein